MLSIRLQRMTSKFPGALFWTAVRLVALHAAKLTSHENTKHNFLLLLWFNVKFANAADMIPDPGPTSNATVGLSRRISSISVSRASNNI